MEIYNANYMFSVFDKIMGNKDNWRENTVRSDEGNQKLYSIIALQEEEKQPDHEKMENKRNSFKELSVD
jgi:hypothetical protein